MEVKFLWYVFVALNNNYAHGHTFQFNKFLSLANCLNTCHKALFLCASKVCVFVEHKTQSYVCQHEPSNMYITKQNHLNKWVLDFMTEKQ